LGPVGSLAPGSLIFLSAGLRLGGTAHHVISTGTNGSPEKK
jgi:hypothetical protein